MYIKKDCLSDICENIYSEVIDYVYEHIDYDKLELLDVLVDYEDVIDKLITEASEEYIFENDYLQVYEIQVRNEILDYLIYNHNFDDIKDELFKEALQDKTFFEMYKFNKLVDNY